MEVDVRWARIQPGRLRAGDHMHGVAGAAEVARQFGRNGAASADRSVADDPDVHQGRMSIGREKNFTGSSTVGIPRTWNASPWRTWTREP